MFVGAGLSVVGADRWDRGQVPVRETAFAYLDAQRADDRCRQVNALVHFAAAGHVPIGLAAADQVRNLILTARQGEAWLGCWMDLRARGLPVASFASQSSLCTRRTCRHLHQGRPRHTRRKDAGLPA